MGWKKDAKKAAKKAKKKSRKMLQAKRWNDQLEQQLHEKQQKLSKM